MTSYDWTAIRADAIRRFQDEPSPKLETDILNIFREAPARVVNAINQIAADYAKGTIRSPWGALRARLQRQAATGSVTAVDLGEREAAVAKAEQWIRNAGLHYDLEREVEDDLFGDTGALRDWADDDLLRHRLLGIWREHRPRGAKVEAEVLARVVQHNDWIARWKKVQEDLRAQRDRVQTEHEAEARARAERLAATRKEPPPT